MTRVHRKEPTHHFVYPPAVQESGRQVIEEANLPTEARLNQELRLEGQ